MVKIHNSVKHYLVSGRVQGVAYRLNTEKTALQLGLTGWVRNLADGRVELIASGTAEQHNALEAWLWQGPARASVIQVIVRDIVLETPVEFVVADSADKEGSFTSV